MISKQQIKIYSSLKLKKNRKEHGLFLVEGIKAIEELLKSDYKILALLCDKDTFNNYPFTNKLSPEIVSSKTLERISNMKNASNIIAVVKTPQEELKIQIHSHSILIEDIQDPGNLGTIIRTAHWFGFNQVICSPNSVDCYNPKVIQSSMGSVFKLPTIYTNLKPLIIEMQKQNMRVIGTFMEGESIYKFNFYKSDSFLLGNEGKGISDQLKEMVDSKVNIPNFSKRNPTESLNIGCAASIFCSEISRK